MITLASGNAHPGKKTNVREQSDGKVKFFSSAIEVTYTEYDDEAVETASKLYRYESRNWDAEIESNRIFHVES